MTTRTSSKRGLTFHPNGTWLAFSENDGKSKTIWDVMLLPLEDGGAGSVKVGQPTPFLADASSERYPSFSPDGRWIAYTSDETGMNEVYVRPFPGPGGKWQISTGGGAYPAWSKTKAELIYETATGGDVQLMSAGYSVKGDAFIAERARPWTSAHIGTAGSHAWALHPDGAHVAGTPPQARTFVKQDTVVLFLNFFDEVRRRTNLGP
jgi:WD40 repeat protein